MNMHQQLRNVRMAQENWKQVNSEEVTKNLTEWNCGSAHCFGGWVLQWPEFQALGVESFLGKPALPHLKLYHPGVVSKHLFGYQFMFSPRRYDEKGTDHEVVTARLAVRERALMGATLTKGE